MNEVVADKSRLAIQWKVLLHHFLIYLALSTAAIAQPLLQMYGDNLTVFTTAGFEGIGILGFMLLVLLAMPITFSVIELLAWIVFPRGRDIVHYLLVFVCLFTLVLVLTRSITTDIWIFHIVMAMSLAGGLLWLFHKFAAVKVWIRWMSPLALVVAGSFVFAVRDVVWVPEVQAVDLLQDVSQPEIAQDVNRTPAEDVSIIWVVMDEAPLYPLLDANGQINRERFPGFGKLADTSTWYRNVVSPSQRTTDAVPSMLSGRKPKVNADPILANYKQNAFTLMNSYIGFDVREYTTALCPDSICGTISVSGFAGDDEKTNEMGSNSSVDESYAGYSQGLRFSFSRFVKDSLVVLGHKVLPSGLRKNLPAIDQTWGGFGGDGSADGETEASGEIADVSDVTTTSQAPEREVVESSIDAETQKEKKAAFRESGPATLIPPFEAMVERASKSAKPTFYFQHVMLPHRPWKMTPDQRLYPGAVNPAKSEDDAVRDNSTDINVLRHEYRALLMQYAAVDKMIDNLVTQLQQSDNWDKTMIVLAADHGISMESGTFRRKQVDPDRPGTLEDLYRVPLFIKYPDQKTGEVNDCDVMHFDVLPTVAAVKQFDAGWVYDGVNLQTECPDRPVRDISWDKGKTTIATDWRALLDRVALYGSYVPLSGGIDGIFGFGEYASLIGTNVSTTTSSSSIAQWQVEQKDQFANISSARFASVPAQITGTVTLSRAVPKNVVGVVTVNGVVAGFINEISGASAGSVVPYRAMLSTSQLKSGQHTIGVTVVSGDPNAPVFERVIFPL